jgi:hypothetical protein
MLLIRRIAANTSYYQTVTSSACLVRKTDLTDIDTILNIIRILNRTQPNIQLECSAFCSIMALDYGKAGGDQIGAHRGCS